MELAHFANLRSLIVKRDPEIPVLDADLECILQNSPLAETKIIEGSVLSCNS